MSFARLAKHLGLFVLLLWVGTGCYLPIKQVPPQSREYSSGLQDNFAPGQTSRTDVLLAMGEPDSVSFDESILTYRWQTIDGIIVVTQCTPPIEVTSETTLTLSFDEDGVLQDINITSS